MKRLRHVITLTAAMLMAVMHINAVSVDAAEPQNGGGTHDLSIEQGVAEGITDTDISVDLYKIADIKSGTGDGMQYVPHHTYNDSSYGGKSLGNILHGNMNDTERHDVAQAALHTIFRIDETSARQQVFPDYSSVFDGQTIRFQNLPPGAYLIVTRQSGCGPDNYVKGNQTGDITTHASNEKHTYRWIPSIVSIYDGGSSKTFNVKLKPSVENIPSGRPDGKYSSLNITKHLESHAGSRVTFTFTAEVYGNRTEYEKGSRPDWTIPVSMTFDGKGSKTVSASHLIPEDCFLVIYENDPDRPYKLTGMSCSMDYRDGTVLTVKDDGMSQDDCLKIENSGYGNAINAEFSNRADGGGNTGTDGTPVQNLTSGSPTNPTHTSNIPNQQVKTGESSYRLIIYAGIICAVAGTALLMHRKKTSE